MKMPTWFLSSRASTALASLILLCVSASVGCGPDDPAENNDDNNTTCALDCESPAPVCDGDVVVQATSQLAEGTCTCEPGTDVRTDCSQTGKTCMAGVCVDRDETDKCANVSCDASPAAACDGSSVVSYSESGTCNPTTGMCEYEETRTDCAAMDPAQACLGGACVEVGSCEDEDCTTPPATACDGNTLKEYAAAGSCDDNSMCIYASTDTNCEDDDKVCRAGACVEDNDGTTRAPVAGEIVITEIMYDTVGPDGAAIDDNKGEWVEIYNKTDDTLDLEGLVFQDAVDNNAYTFPAGVTVPPKSYFVLGINDDAATNGNVTVNAKYTKIGFNNSGGDTVVLKTAGGDELAKVVYDFSAGWTDVVGASLQLSGDVDLENDTDLDDPSNWCPSTTAWDGADFGTPGAANTNCPDVNAAMLFTIVQLQDESDAAHPAPATPVRIEGATVSAVSDSAIWVQSASAPNSGIKINVVTATLNLVAGTSVVDVKGVYREDNGTAVIDADIADVTLSATPAIALTPMPLTRDVLASPALLEAHESLLVRIEQPAVTSDNPDAPAEFGEFLLNNTLRVDDALFAQATPETTCDTFQYVQGVMAFSFSNYKVYPRDASDLGARVSTSASLGDATVTFTSGVAGNGFLPSVVCIAQGAKVTFSNASTMGPVSVISRDVDNNDDADANPAIDLTIPMAADRDFTPAGPGVYPYRETQNVSVKGVVIVTPPAAP